MHCRWVCAKVCVDYQQQVHLRIFHSSNHCLASDKQKEKHRLVNNIGAEWLLTSMVLLQHARPRIEPRERPLTIKSVKLFLCQVILLFLCHHLLASPALDLPARLVVSLVPSPAAHHSRSRVTQRGSTEENLTIGQRRRRKGGG